MLSDIQIQRKIEILKNKMHAGNFDEVIAEASILIKKNKHQIIFNILSLAYQSKGELKKSETIMDEALKLNPNNPYFLNNMGITQHKMENLKIAEEYFERGLKIVPNYINILNNLGNLKKDLDQTDEALKYYKKSLSINPKVIETLLNISICYQSLGKFREAKNHLFELLKIDPAYTIADRLISSMTRYEDEEDVHLKEMKKKVTQLKLNEIQLANLRFSLGKAYEDLKKYELSFENYNKGNEILKKIFNFNIKDEESNFEIIKKIFSNHSKNTAEKNSRKVIFILGMPRSGTSLIEHILSSHNNVYGGGELSFLKNIIDDKFLNNANIKSNIINYEKEIFQDAQNNYILKISQIDKSSKVFTDKSPLNFRYIGFIKKIFPNSKIINCKRNSLDICWSNFKNFFGGSLPFTNNLIDLANYNKIYEDLMNFWEKKFPQQIYHLDYDKLINNSENEIKKILNFCELEWDENCLKHEKNTKAIKTASASQARQPINKAGLKTFEPYKDYLTEISSILKN